MNIVEKTYAITADDLSGVINVNTQLSSLADLVTLAISWLIYLAGILAFIFLVYAGILYITAGGNPEQAKKGQQGLINAIIGIIIVVLAYAILRVVGNLANTGV